MRMSEITKQFKEGKILAREKFSIEARAIAMAHDAVQNAQTKVLVLEAKISELELQIYNNRPLREAIYG